MKSTWCMKTSTDDTSAVQLKCIIKTDNTDRNETRWMTIRVRDDDTEFSFP